MRDRRAEDMVALGECGLRCPKEGHPARQSRSTISAHWAAVFAWVNFSAHSLAR